MNSVFFLTDPYAFSFETSTPKCMDFLPTPVVSLDNQRKLTIYHYMYELAKAPNSPPFEDLLKIVEEKGLICEFTEIDLLIAHATLGYAETGLIDRVNELTPEGCTNRVLSYAARGYAKRGFSVNKELKALLHRGANFNLVLRGYAASQDDWFSTVPMLSSPTEDNYEHVILGLVEHGNRPQQVRDIVKQFASNRLLYIKAIGSACFAYAYYGHYKEAYAWIDHDASYSDLPFYRAIAQGLAEGGHDILLDTFIIERKKHPDLYEHATYGYEKVGRIREPTYLRENTIPNYFYPHSGGTSAAAGHHLLAMRIFHCHPESLNNIIKSYVEHGQPEDVQLWLLKNKEKLNLVIETYRSTHKITTDQDIVKILAHFSDNAIRENMLNLLAEHGKFTSQRKRDIEETASSIAKMMKDFGFTYHQAQAMRDTARPNGFRFILQMLHRQASLPNTAIDFKYTNFNPAQLESLAALAFEQYKVEPHHGTQDIFKKIIFFYHIKSPIIYSLQEALEDKLFPSDFEVFYINSLVDKCSEVYNIEDLIALLKDLLDNDRSFKTDSSLAKKVKEIFTNTLRELNVSRSSPLTTLSLEERLGLMETHRYHDTQLFAL